MDVNGQLRALAALTQGKNSGTHPTGGNVGSRVGLDGYHTARYMT
jgi:hypothetical protein